MTGPESTRTSSVAGAGRAPARASARATARVLSVGSVLSAGMFALAALLVAAGRPAPSGPALDPVAALRGLADLDPRAWATGGVIVLLATPVLGLLTTVAEYRRVEVRFSAVALLVLAVLAASFAAAMLH